MKKHQKLLSKKYSINLNFMSIIFGLLRRHASLTSRNDKLNQFPYIASLRETCVASDVAIQKIAYFIILFLMFFSQKCYAAGEENLIEGHSLIIKFFGAMLGVLLSAVFIWIVLKLYKKFMVKDTSKFDKINYNTTLESPKDFKEAINLFLEKTDRT